MIPLYKLFVVTGRLFAKPILTMIKKRHKSTKEASQGLFAKFFILLGNREHKIDLWLNRKILSLGDDADMFVKPLNNDVALEKGIEFFYECLVYFIIIALSIYELRRTALDSQLQKEKNAEVISELTARIESLENTSALYIATLQNIESKLNEIDAMIKKKSNHEMSTQYESQNDPKTSEQTATNGVSDKTSN